jgi:hypothetical protein
MKFFPLKIFVFLALFLSAFGAGLRFWPDMFSVSAPAAPASSAAEPAKFHLPAGKDIFQIVQAKEVWPKIVQATIDPIDVYVGQTQSLSIVIQSQAPIASVVAQIETDHGVKVLPLVLVGPTAAADLLPVRFVVDDNNHLAFVDSSRSLAKAGISLAKADEPPKLTYSAKWTVEDTHHKTYRTTFVVKDSEGNKNSITLAWSDACSIPDTGNWTMGSDCTLPAAFPAEGSVDGVDNGNATIAHTLTLAGANFVFNSGKSISVTTGHIAISSGGQILKTNLWREDADNDQYKSSAEYAADASSTLGVGVRAVRRYTVSQAAYDCYDASSLVYPTEPDYKSTSVGGWGWDYDCSGVIEYQNDNDLYPWPTDCTTDPYNGGCVTFAQCDNNVPPTPGWQYYPPGCGGSQYVVNSCTLNPGPGCGGGILCSVVNGSISLVGQYCK